MAEQFSAQIVVETDQAITALAKLQRSLEDTGTVSGKKGAVAVEKAQGDILKAVNKTADGVDAANKKITVSDEKRIAGLARTRYALYDVSNAAAVAGVALGAAFILPAKAAIDFERSFANVARTTGVAGESAKALEQSLIDLSTTIPVSFEQITAIATLAGQLGIASGSVDEFTSTVAKFSATTDLTVEASATALGRLAQLLPDVGERYDNLASSILRVGVNSVATESQIVAISTQIAGIATAAGLTTDEVIGLSGALASAGTAPELSRGLVTRLFTNIQLAIAGGGTALEDFGKISGKTGAEFQQSWQSDAGATLLSFFDGIAARGEGATSALQALGIASVRDIPAIIRLAGASDVLRQSLEDAGIGFANGADLNSQYGVIAETTASKLETLKNSFQAFLAAVGEGATALGPLIDALNNVFKGLSAIASSEVGSGFAVVILALTALAAGVSLIGAVSGRAFANVLALEGAMAGLGVSAGIATGALTALKIALITTGIGAVVVLIGSAIAGIMQAAGAFDTATEAVDGNSSSNANNAETVDELAKQYEQLSKEVQSTIDILFEAENATNKTRGALSDLGDVLANGGDQAAVYGGKLEAAIRAISEQDPTNAARRLQYLLEFIQANTPTATLTIAKLQAAIASLSGGKAVAALPFDVSGFVSGMKKVSSSAGSATKKIVTLKDYASQLAKVFDRAFEIRFSSGDALDSVAKSFNDIASATADARQEISDLNADIASLTADRAIQEYFLSVAEAYGDTLRAGEIRANLLDIDNKLAKANKSLTNAQDKVTKSTVGNSDAALENRAQLRSLVGDYQDYIQALAASGADQATLAATSARLKQEFIAQAKQLGFAEAELGVYAAAFDDVSYAVANVPRNINVDIDPNPAITALNEILAAAENTAGGVTEAFDNVDTNIDTVPTVKALDKLEQQELRRFTNAVNADMGKSGDAINRIFGKTFSDLGVGSSTTSGKLLYDFNNASNGIVTGISSKKDPFKVALDSVVGASNTSSSWQGFTNSVNGAAGTIPQAISNQKGAASNQAWMVGQGAGSSVNSGLGSSLNIPGKVSANVLDAKYPAGVNANSVGNSIGSSITGGISSILNYLLGTNTAPRKIVRSITGFATGGYVSGKGGPTSDSIPAMLSNGEYVIKASAVSHYGMGMLNALNQMQVPKRGYASGGVVGMAPIVNVTNSNSTMVELSPTDRALLRSIGGSGEVTLVADNMAIARSANAGNRDIVASGGRP